MAAKKKTSRKPAGKKKGTARKQGASKKRTVSKKKVVAKRRPAPKKRPARALPEAFRARAAQGSFTVNDLAKSTAFYCNGIGFTLLKEWTHEGRVMGNELRAGSVEIYLSQDDGAKGWDRVKGVGCSLSLVTAQKVDTVAARLKKAGYALLSEPGDMPWGTRSFRVADPDGFVIAISSA